MKLKLEKFESENHSKNDITNQGPTNTVTETTNMWLIHDLDRISNDSFYGSMSKSKIRSFDRVLNEANSQENNSNEEPKSDQIGNSFSHYLYESQNKSKSILSLDKKSTPNDSYTENKNAQNNLDSNLFRIYLEQKNSNRELKKELSNSYLKQYMNKLTRKSITTQINEHKRAKDLDANKDSSKITVSYPSQSTFTNNSSEESSSNFNQKFFSFKSRLRPRWLPVYF